MVGEEHGMGRQDQPNSEISGETGSQGAVIIIADDHPLFCAALGQAIKARISEADIRETNSFHGVQALLDKGSADLILLDINMPGMQGYSGLLYMRAQYPQVPVAIVSAIEDETVIHSAIQFGALGYIPKSLSLEDIGTAIEAIMDGEVWLPPGTSEAPSDDGGEDAKHAARLQLLTPQQVRVLMYLSDGKLNKQIAHELSISEATVKAHVSAILQKLKVNSRTQAVIIAGSLAAEDQAEREAKRAVRNETS